MANLQTILELVSRGGTTTRREFEEAAKGPDAIRAAFDKADESFKKIPRSLRAVDAGLRETRSNLEGVAGRLGVVGQAANAIGPVGTIAAAAAVGITAGATAVATLAREAANAAGELVDLADLTGVSTATLQSYRIAAAGAGVGTDAFNKAIQTFTKNTGDAELGAGKLSSKLKALDPDFLQIVNNAATVEDKFDLVIAKLNELPAGAERAALATAAFGAEGAKIANVGEAVDDVRDRYEGLNAVIGEDTLRAADAAGDALDEQTAILRQQILVLETEAAPAILNFEAQWVRGAGRVVAGLVEILEKIGLIDQSANDEFADLSKRRNELAVNLRTVQDNPGARTNAAQQQAAIANLKEEIRLIDERMRVIRDGQKADKSAADQETANLKRSHDLRLGELREVQEQQKLQSKLDGDRKKSASDAEASAKRVAEAHKRGLAEVERLEQTASTAGLDGIEKLEAEREVAYAKFAELVAEDGLNQEEAARGYLAIWTATDRAVTAEREKESDKRAAAAEREAEKQAAAAAKLAEQEAEAFRRPMENVADDIGDVLGNALTGFVRKGKVDFDELWSGFLDAGLNAIAELVSQQISLNLVAAVTGQQQPGQLVNLFGNNKQSGVFGDLFDGATDLVSGFFNLGTSAADLAGQVGIAAADIGNAGSIAIDAAVNGAYGVGGAPLVAGLEPATAAQVGGLGGEAAGGLGAAAIGGIFAGILGAVLGSVGAVDSLRRGQRFAFDQDDIVDLLNKGAIEADPFGLARIVGADRVTRGVLEDDPSAVDRSIAAVLTIGTSELVRLAGLTPQPSTGGTVGRSHFEKRVEAVTDFFANDFDRTLGQDHARKFSDSGRGDFREGLLDFGKEAGAEIPGFDDVTNIILRAAAGVARADLGDKIGDEPQRNAALYATLIGNLAENGADFVAAMQAGKQVLDSFGPPPRVFDIFNDFVNSDANDIVPEDAFEIVRGLGAAYFSDLIPAQLAARVALKDYQETGELVFGRIKEKVLAVAAEFQALQPLYQDLAAAVTASPSDFVVDGIVKPEVFTEFHDKFAEVVASGFIEGFEQATLEATFEPVFTPQIAKGQSIIKDLTEGKISPEEAASLLAGVGEEISSSLELLDPVIEQTVKNIALIANAFHLAGDAAAGAADDVRHAVDDDVQHQILGLLDPDVQQQFDLEKRQRERYAAARAAGADLVEVERLNGLEREALAEQLAERRTQIEEQAADQIQRTLDSFYDGVASRLEALRDLATDLTATPSSPLATTTAFANAQANLEQLFSAAEGGDADALEKIPDAFQAAVGLAQQLFGSTSDFFDFFTPGLERLQALGNRDPEDFDLSADARETIAAIESARDEQLAADERHHEEAIELMQRMVDALELDEKGNPRSTSGGGSGSGDFILRGVPGPPDGGSGGANGGSSGRFDLGETEQANFKAVLDHAVVGGRVHQEFLRMLDAGVGFDGSEYGKLLRRVFSGARSRSGQNDVLEAGIEKIEDPEKFQPIFGFRNEGSFQVRGAGGFDRVPVGFNASAGEHVYVTTASLTEMLRDLGDAIVVGDGREQLYLRDIAGSLRSIESRLAAVEAARELAGLQMVLR